MTSVVTSQRVTDRYGIQHPAPSASTGANLPNYGLSLIASTGAYVLDPPKVGVQAIIAVSAASTGASTVDTNSTTVTFASTAGGLNTATFDATGEALVLIGASETEWIVVSNVGSVVLS